VNLWECEYPGCDVTATGCGGGRHLWAIGWYFVPGSKLRCPRHHPAGFGMAVKQAELFAAMFDKLPPIPEVDL